MCCPDIAACKVWSEKHTQQLPGGKRQKRRAAIRKAPKRRADFGPGLRRLSGPRRIRYLRVAAERFDGVALSAPLARAQDVERGVGGRGVEPRRGVMSFRWMLAIEGDEDVLCDVLGLVGISHHAVSDRDHPGVLLPEELFEGRRQALAGDGTQTQALSHFHLFLQSTAKPPNVTDTPIVA